jgi:hypothetical protein
MHRVHYPCTGAVLEFRAIREHESALEWREAPDVRAVVNSRKPLPAEQLLVTINIHIDRSGQVYLTLARWD